MDLLQEIREKIKNNPSIFDSGFNSVITHIEIAEKYYYRAKSDNDEHLYTDVIYRTNHAFEGILKEAHYIFTGNVDKKITPYTIENYFLSESILKDRVLSLLKNYRQSWRNPATHDYQLFFSNQESFLAIINVSAFISILLDQIIERKSYTNKLHELESAAILARDAMKGFNELPAIEKVSKILTSYSSYYIKNFELMSTKPISVRNSELAAFIQTVAPDFKIKFEPVFNMIDSPEDKVYFDMIIMVENEKIALETHTPKHFNNSDSSEETQLIKKLDHTQVKAGVVYYYPSNSKDIPITTTNSTSWPSKLSIRVVNSVDEEYIMQQEEQAIDLVPE